MNIDHYLLDLSVTDWSQALRPWHWLLPATFEIWIANKFCDLFVLVEDGSVHMLDIGDGSFTRVATSRDAFCDMANDDEQANNLLMIPLVDQLVQQGTTLTSGDCYGFVLSPVLGGAYSCDNIRTYRVADYLETAGSIHDQLRDVADGDQVILEIINRPTK